MEKTTTRIIIETVVKKTFKEIKESPERSIRNLVDMALHFSKGHFQHDFFTAAQTMLQNDKSCYYALIKDTVDHVDEKHLLDFGINLGYNGCTIGAATIRKMEETQGFNIPWILTLQLNPKQQQPYHSVIAQGESIGIHTWLLDMKEEPESALSLVEQHQDSAFLLLCYPQAITQTFLELASRHTNLMIVVHDETGCTQACAKLRQAKLLYSVCVLYSENDVPKIESGELFEEMEQSHPVFTGLYAAPDCPQSARERVWKAVNKARNDQSFQTIAWELVFDTSYIDSIISSEACLAGFDAEGKLITAQGVQADAAYNLFAQDLPSILKQAFPKTRVNPMLVQ